MKMEKSKLMKIVLIIIMVSMGVLLSARQAFAVDSFTDLTNTIDNSTTNTTTLDNTTNNTTTNNTVANNTINNTFLTTTNTSTRNNTTLPNTGLAENTPVILLVVVFAISAVYAYKKIQDYKNI